MVFSLSIFDDHFAWKISIIFLADSPVFRETIKLDDPVFWKISIPFPIKFDDPVFQKKSVLLPAASPIFWENVSIFSISLFSGPTFQKISIVLPSDSSIFWEKSKFLF